MDNNRLLLLAVGATVALVFLLYLAATFNDPAETETVEESQPPAPPVTETTPQPEPVIPPAPTPEPPAEEEEEDTVEVPEDPQVAQQDTEAEGAQEDQPEPAVETEPASEPEPEPEPEETVSLPSLNASDDFVQERVAELEAGSRVLRMMTPDEIVRKFVIFVENASRGILPQRDRPVEGPDEEIQVRRLGEDRWLMESESYDRFDPLVNTFMAVETEQAVSLYNALSPLFQEAYAEMGYPNQDFNEVLAEAIDNVLNAETPQGPFELIRPSVMYRYADEEIENLSDVEKLLLRMGPENAARVKEKLQAFRTRLLETQ